MSSSNLTVAFVRVYIVPGTGVFTTCARTRAKTLANGYRKRRSDWFASAYVGADGEKVRLHRDGHFDCKAVALAGVQRSTVGAGHGSGLLFTGLRPQQHRRQGEHRRGPK